MRATRTDYYTRKRWQGVQILPGSVELESLNATSTGCGKNDGDR